MYKQISILVGIMFLFAMAVSPVDAQLPQIAGGLSYITSSQNPDGTWGADSTSVETTYATVSAIEALKLLNQNTGTAYTSATAWLQSRSPQPVDYIAQRIHTLSLTDNSINSLIPLLALPKYAWGGDEGFVVNNLDTASSLKALKAANYSTPTVTFNVISYLLSTQNTDGGWGFTQGDDSNVYVTSLVLSALAQFKSVNIMDQQLAKTAALLYSAQNGDGGFGTGASTVYETALAFIALVESGQIGAQQATPLQNAVNYITSNQSTDGSWNADPYSTALALRALAYVKPDLAIGMTDIAVSPLSPTVGDTLTVTATVHNSGLDTVANVLVRLLDNNVIVGQQTIPAIAPGAAVPATFTIAPLTPSGEHILTVMVDPLNTISEVSKANNSATLRIWAKSPADLVVMPEYLNVTPAYPKPGENITLTANIANMGESAAGSFSADLYDGDPASGGTKIGSFTVSGINAGAWGSGTLTVSLATEGNHNLYVVVDPQNSVTEQNRANNSASKTITVSATGATGLADLTITYGGLQITPARPKNGDSTTITIMARNLGTVAATASLELFDGLPASGGTLLHQESVTLNPGESRTIASPWTATPGIHTLYAVIDRAGLVTETDKTNNNQTLVVMTDMVDIEVSASDIDISPEHPMDGDPAAVKVIVHNRGIAATGPFNANLYNGDPANGGTLLQSFAITDLAGDATQEITYPFTAARGTYRFYALCDPENRVVEADENDNLAIRTLLVKTSAEAKGPDLVPLAFDLSGTTTDPQSLRISGMALVNFQNKGDDKVTTPFRIMVFEDMDGDGVYTEGIDNALGWWDYSAAMNPNMVGVVNVNLSGTVTFRDAPIYAMLDSGQYVFEQNKDNNTIRRGSACENRPSNPIQPVLKWQWRTHQAFDFANAIFSPPVVMTVPDGQGGKQTVVLLVGMAPLSINGELHAFDGKTGTELWSYYDPAHPIRDNAHIAVADINHDGLPEIIFPTLNGDFHGLICLSHDGQFLWDNSAAATQWYNQHHTALRFDGGSPAIADIDGDGNPEIVVSSTIVNGDGSIRSGSKLSSGQGLAATNEYYSIVADIDLDGKQEVIAGNAAYDYTGAVKWFNQSLPDGVNAIFNSDDDPYPEIVLRSYDSVSKKVKVYLLDHDGSIKWGPVYLPGTSFFGGPPVVADFDGDGQQEIAIKGYGNLIILDKNGAAKNTIDISPGDYSLVAPTVFDLNGDGKPEVIINSGQYFRIFEGATGNKLFETSFGTGDVYSSINPRNPLAIVADVDGDGHAEIVVVGGYSTTFTNSVEKGIKVYGAMNNDWIGTRGVWNQASYHVTNVNDDGTIPMNEAPSWLLNNNYLCNIPTSSAPNPYLAADISASFVRVDMANDPASVTLTARIGNGGAKTVNAGLKTSFYDGDPANGGVLIGPAVTSKALISGDYEDVTLVWNGPASGNHSVYVSADPDNTVGECDKSNNTVSLPVYIASGIADLSIVADEVVVPASIPEGSMTSIQVTVRNVGTMQAQNVLVRLFAGNPATGGKQIGADQTIPAIAAGGMMTAGFTWNTLGALGSNYLYAIVDPANTIAESNENNNTAIKQVTVTPAVKPDLQIASQDISITPAVPTQGDALSVAVTIHNLGLATGNVRATLYNGNPASGGTVVGTTVMPQIIPSSGSATAAFTLDTVALSGAVTLFVKVDPDNLIDESDKTNNQATKGVTISPAGLNLGINTNKAAYGANENIQVIISLAELKGQARTLAYDLRIVDKNSIVTATAATDVALSLAPNAATAFTVAWNTSTTLSGPYTILAQVKESGRIIAKAAAPFTILPDLNIVAKVTTDKISYNPNETVTLAATVTSQSKNTILENLGVTVTIKDNQGTVRFTDTKTITTLISGAAFTFKIYWNTGKFAPGSYPVTIEVKDASGAVLATGTQALEISRIIKPSAVLKGQVSVDKQSVLSGDKVNISCNVTNTGNVDLPNVNFSLLTVHAVNQSVYDTLTYQAVLPMGASYTNSGLIDTTAYSAKDYLVILRASIDGVEETLAGTYFRVEGAPSAPALSAPANGADVETFTPALTVSNAADPNDDKLTYEFELYADTGLTNLIASSGAIPETTGTTTWTVPVPLTENLTFFWRARAYDGKLYGPWMAPAFFRVNTVNDLPTAPTISSPADGTTVAVLTPTLTVNNASDPDSANLTYNFQIALDPDFNQIVTSTIGVTSGQGTTSWTSTESLQENGWYYWRAQADDWLIEGPWSTTARFQVNTANDAPTTPVITAPVNGSTVAALETDVVVTNSTDPDSNTLSYFFEADTVPTFDSPNIFRSGAVAAGENSTLWRLIGLRDNTQYYVRAKASDGAADSSWSAVTGFTANTVNDPPTTPILANPSNGAGVNLFTPTLSVHNSTDPDKDPLTYEFALYADAAMTNRIAHAAGIAEMGDVTSWVTPVALTENRTYYWQARAFDGALNSAWMPVASFTVNTANDAPGAPALSSPATGSSVATLTPTLAVVNAVDPDSDNLTYEFEIYSGTTLVTRTSGVAEDISGVTAWTPGNALADNTVYQWRARAYDGDRYGAWANMGNFSVHMPTTSIGATINFDPDTLNKKSKGNWVVVYIELPAGYNPSEIDISSLRLEGTIPAEPRPYEIGDYDKDGISDLMVKFNRSDAINLLPNGEHVVVHVTGKVGSTAFEGVDIIRVIK